MSDYPLLVSADDHIVEPPDLRDEARRRLEALRELVG